MKMSVDREWLHRLQFDDYLARTFQISVKQLHPEAAKLVINTASKSCTCYGDYLSQQAMVDTVELYVEYRRHFYTIDRMFQKYEKAKDGALDRYELFRLLQDEERKTRRAVKGIAVTLVLSQQGLDWVISESDADGSGKISPAELLPALAAWEELVKRKLEQREQAMLCTIL